MPNVLKTGDKVEDFFCLEKDSGAFDIRGDYSSDQFNYMEVEFNPCRQEEQDKDPEKNLTCASAREQDLFMHNKSIQFYYMNADIDLTSYSSTPTRYQINTELYIPLSRYSEKKINLFVAPMVFENGVGSLGQGDS